MNIIIRKGKKEDLPAVLELIKELALYEKAPQEVITTVASMKKDGFGDRPYFEFIVAEFDGEIVGMALYFFSYSTWKGRAIYLEDIIVTKLHRRKDIGKKLFDSVVEHAKQTGAKRLAWQVLDWNQPAIEFYKKINAELDGEWINGRLNEKQIREWNSGIVV